VEVVGERESYIEYYENDEKKETIKPPEDFMFTVNAR
jgi:hypothetical protein